MKTQIGDTYVKLWLSARETYDWARKPGGVWPCSQLAGKRVFAEFDRKGLVDLAINGKMRDCDGTELSAICADYLAPKLAKDHPAYFVAVQQFKA